MKHRGQSSLEIYGRTCDGDIAGVRSRHDRPTQRMIRGKSWLAYVTASEVTALEHEVGDDAVEGRLLEALPAGSLAQL